MRSRLSFDATVPKPHEAVAATMAIAPRRADRGRARANEVGDVIISRAMRAISALPGDGTLDRTRGKGTHLLVAESARVVGDVRIGSEGGEHPTDQVVELS